MKVANKRTRVLALGFILAMATVDAAHAQVAPVPAPTTALATPTFKAGWIVQVVSFKGGAMGEIPFATYIAPAAQEDLFAPLSKLGVAGNEAGLILRGLVNAPEIGRYGLLLTLTSPARGTYCRYSLSIDGAELVNGRDLLTQARSTDKALDLTAGRHPAELRLACSNGLPQIRVGLRVKLPSADVLAAPSSDFIIHPTRATGD